MDVAPEARWLIARLVNGSAGQMARLMYLISLGLSSPRLNINSSESKPLSSLKVRGRAWMSETVVSSCIQIPPKTIHGAGSFIQHPYCLQYAVPKQVLASRVVLIRAIINPGALRPR